MEIQKREGICQGRRVLPKGPHLPHSCLKAEPRPHMSPEPSPTLIVIPLEEEHCPPTPHLSPSEKALWQLQVLPPALWILTATLSFLNQMRKGGSKKLSGTSLVAQWLRIRLPMQGTQVRALVREDPTCRGATKPVCHNY